MASCRYDRPNMTPSTQNLWIPRHSTSLLFITGNVLVGQLAWKWKNRQQQSKRWHLLLKPNSAWFHWELPYFPPYLSLPQYCIYLFKIMVNSWCLKQNCVITQKNLCIFHVLFNNYFLHIGSLPLGLTYSHPMWKMHSKWSEPLAKQPLTSSYCLSGLCLNSFLQWAEAVEWAQAWFVSWDSRMSDHVASTCASL